MRCCFAAQEKPSSKSCPIWSDYSVKQQKCECQDGIGDLLRCTDDGYIVGLHGCSCTSYNWSSGITTIGFCLFGCNLFYDKSFEEPVNISALSSINTCSSYKRNGSLCGTCHKDSYPSVYSFSMDCIYCRHITLSWITFFMWTLVPLTIFYVVIMFLTVNLMSSKLSGYIIFSQSVSLPIVVRMMLLRKTNTSHFCIIFQIFGAIYGIWNLDFFRTFGSGICLGTNALITLFLDVAISLYPLLLLIITHKFVKLYGKNQVVAAILKPAVKLIMKFKSSGNIRTSMIDSFATFVYLINVKILNSCFDLLVPVRIYNLTDKQIVSSSRRLFYNADIVYFGADHRPYGITAIIVLIVLVLLPTLLLLLYPLKTFQKLLNRLLSPRWQLFLRTFLESFNGCYKDGTKESEKDCRYFAAFPFIIRITIFLFYAESCNASFLVFGSVLLTTYSLFLIIKEPFKDQYKYLQESYLLFNLLLSCSSVCYALYPYSHPGYQNFPYLVFIVVTISLTSPGVYMVIHFVYTIIRLLYKLLFK